MAPAPTLDAAPTDTFRAVDAERRYPAALAAAIDRRRLLLLAQAHGAVLDLDLPEARDEIWRAASASRRGEPSVPGAYDTVVSTFRLVRFADLRRALIGIERLLAPEGELLVFEPMQHIGRVSLLTSTIWARHPAVAGLHVERDVAVTIRSVGLVLTDFERPMMPTHIRPLRRFLQARARRFARPESFLRSHEVVS